MFIASIIPVDGKLSSVDNLDTLAHLGEYLLLAWLLLQAMQTSGMQRQASGRWAWLMAAGYGLLIEFIQAMIPWRSAELADALANAVGAALGVWLGRKQSIVHSR